MKYTEAVALRRSVKKSALGNSAKFTGKHLCWTIYFNEVTGLQVLKKETPKKGAFPWILQNRYEHLYL